MTALAVELTATSMDMTEMYRQFYSNVTAFLRSRAPMDYEDLAADVFEVALIAHAEGKILEGKEGHWLTRTATFLLYNHNRKAQRRATVPVDSQENVFDLHSPELTEGGFEDEVIDRMLMEQAWDSLSDAHKSVLADSLAGQPLDNSTSSDRARLCRARAKFEQAYQGA